MPFKKIAAIASILVVGIFIISSTQFKIKGGDMLMEKSDKYSWLRDDNWPNVKDGRVLSFLNDENQKTGEFFKPYSKTLEQIFGELKSRIKEDDFSVPVQIDDFFYYSFINKGQDYWVHARKKGDLTQQEEIILDENILAKGKDYCKVVEIEESPNHRYIAYAVDFSGDERYSIYVKDMHTGKLLPDVIEDTMSNIVWHENGLGFFYVPANEFWRADKVMYHALGEAEDKLIYKEEDTTFRVSFSKSGSKQFLFLDVSSSNASEVSFIRMDDVNMKLNLIAPRHEDHLYSVDHHGGLFLILTNDQGKNFRLVKAPVDKPNQDNWQEVVAHDKSVYLYSFDAYKNFFALTSKVDGLSVISTFDTDFNKLGDIKFVDPVYEVSVRYTTFDACAVRYSYSSLKSPNSVLEYDVASAKSTVLKTQEVPSGYNPDDYQLERVWAQARDGVKIPVSVLYKKQLVKKDGSAPLYLYGYGSYGMAMPTSFRTSILSLVDRGFVYAIAHIRGGDELGFEWYEAAKFLTKKRTFEDFIDVAEHLINAKFTSKGELVIAGGSAGGMLMGVALNERPDLFKAAVAHVPFVDVLNTMLDETLPLTPGEFKEWGNPKQQEYYDYIRSYCPYTNVKVQNYPHLYVTAGLTDPRVTYWEPAKWVAKLREHKTDSNMLFLKTEMEAGHGGKTGRFTHLTEIAEEYTFILKAFNMI